MPIEIITIISRLSNCGKQLIYPNDNAHLHRVHIVNSRYEDVGIYRTDWPVNSLDCNTIEHTWNVLPHKFLQLI